MYMFDSCTSGNLHYTADKFSGGINTFWSECEWKGAAHTEFVGAEPAPGLILTAQRPV